MSLQLVVNGTRAKPKQVTKIEATLEATNNKQVVPHPASLLLSYWATRGPICDESRESSLS